MQASSFPAVFQALLEFLCSNDQLQYHDALEHRYIAIFNFELGAQRGYIGSLRVTVIWRVKQPHFLARSSLQ